MSAIAARAAEARERVEAVLERVGRPPGTVRIVAVSKTFSAQAVAEAARAGLRDFGENRVQEAALKIPQVGVQGLSWHLAGHLQSNKARLAASLFDSIHSVDDADLVHRLEAAAAADTARHARLSILLQVNVSGEAVKAGVAPEGLRALLDTAAACQHLDVRGLMTIPPHATDPERSRPHFAALRELGKKVEQWLAPASYAGELSMGMTEDFEVAIEEGSSIIRLGRALFGERGAASPQRV